ncbi:hypothetical protein KFK09_020249 [Dendrobium nobile]|uniref:Uncharacterized protein n=1 Tax=Dendrobium nobile TaxID=94219 RepID=A0A8T3ART8_DENNO|nr:hypothetical protein KFK09_020249 [Dendrobium nobile]
MVSQPMCFDHSPLITSTSTPHSLPNYFLFKNYWTFMDGLWDDVLSSFSQPSTRSPICHLQHCLQVLKWALKRRIWFTSNYISNSILEQKNKPHICLENIQTSPLDIHLNTSLKEINVHLASFQASWASWISQRAKERWLTQGEDDLDFLYAKIHARRNQNIFYEIFDANGSLSSHQDIDDAFIQHFKGHFNSPKPINASNFSIHVGNCIPPDMASSLVVPFSCDEIKKVVFKGNDSSTPGNRIRAQAPVVKHLRACRLSSLADLPSRKVSLRPDLPFCCISSLPGLHSCRFSFTSLRFLLAAASSAASRCPQKSLSPTYSHNRKAIH